MTRDNLLEVGDLILYMSLYSADLSLVDKVYKKTARIIMAGGFHFLLDRQTDGNRAHLPDGKDAPGVIQIVIPRRRLI